MGLRGRYLGSGLLEASGRSGGGVVGCAPCGGAARVTAAREGNARGPPGGAPLGPVRVRRPDHYGPGPERVTGALPLAGVNGAAIGTALSRARHVNRGVRGQGGTPAPRV